MEELISLFGNIWIKFYFLGTPFFAVTLFLTLTEEYTSAERHRVVAHVTLASAVIAIGMFLFGSIIFGLFGITIAAFQVGAGILLFLSAVQLTQSKKMVQPSNDGEDIAVVPMAMPVIIGPATIGTLMVFGADATHASEKLVGCFALICAVLSIGVTLLLGSPIKRWLGKKGLNVLSKITGLILAAIAAQMIITGIQTAFLIIPS